MKISKIDMARIGVVIPSRLQERIPTSPFKVAHFATFPTALIEPRILTGSRPGDLVMDPFAGSGTTCALARKLGRSYLGIELNIDYSYLIDECIAKMKEGL